MYLFLAVVCWDEILPGIVLWPQWRGALDLSDTLPCPLGLAPFASTSLARRAAPAKKAQLLPAAGRASEPGDVSWLPQASCQRPDSTPGPSDLKPLQALSTTGLMVALGTGHYQAPYWVHSCFFWPSPPHPFLIKKNVPSCIIIKINSTQDKKLKG